MDTRKCQHCGEVKPITEYRPCSQIESGFYWVCRECQDVMRRNYDRSTGRLKDES